MTGVMILAHQVGREVGTDTGCHPDPVGVLEMVSDSDHTEVRGREIGTESWVNCTLYPISGTVVSRPSKLVVFLTLIGWTGLLTVTFIPFCLLIGSVAVVSSRTSTVRCLQCQDFIQSVSQCLGDGLHAFNNCGLCSKIGRVVVASVSHDPNCFLGLGSLLGIVNCKTL